MAKLINRSLKYGTLICTYAFIASVLIQIYARFFMESAPSWTEEASRLFFVYAIAFASGLAYRDGYYVALDFFFDRLPSKIQKGLDMAIPVLIFVLFGLITFFALQFVSLGQKEHSPSLKFSMSFAFFSMVVMALSISYYSLRLIVKKLVKRNDH